MCAVAFMDLLDGTIVNVALPVIRADLLGRRRLLVAGTSLFGISSLVCGLAGSEGVLIGFPLGKTVLSC